MAGMREPDWRDHTQAERIARLADHIRTDVATIVRSAAAKPGSPIVYGLQSVLFADTVAGALRGALEDMLRDAFGLKSFDAAVAANLAFMDACRASALASERTAA
jgi:hypothetical protein